MSVDRQGNWLGQQRIDVPHLRALESAVAGDFDLLAGSILAGKAPLVVAGFRLVTTNLTVATVLQLQVADSTLVHFLASESGSIFHVPADRGIETLSSTNPRLLGSWTPGQVNYVGLDIVRSADPTTTDQVQFLDTTSLMETSKPVPLARTIDYRIVISTTEFDATPGIAPVARVTLDAASGIVEAIDARNIFWRLGTGGTSPDRFNAFAWPNGRKESGTTDFVGGDKSITSLKGWMDAVMSRLWEVGGGEYWYSSVQDHNVVMARTGTAFVSSAEYFEWSGTNLHWKGLRLLFTNSSGTFNTIADITSDTPGLTDLADGECVYVDVDRTSNATVSAVKASLAVLGSPDVPGSRWVLAWRYGSNIYVRDQSYAVGSSFVVATTGAAGGVKLSATDSAAVSPARVATVDSVYRAAIAGGLTRGSDYFDGAGTITIGGFHANDHDVLLRTIRSVDQVQVEGVQNWLADKTAPFVITNLHQYDGGGGADVMSLRLRGFNNGASQREDAHAFEATGAIGFRNVPSTPRTPGPVATAPIRSKVFFRTNGSSSPATKDQYCVMWFDGSVSVIAESPTY